MALLVKVGNEELKLKPGMTANVSIIYASKKDILKIPNAALRFVPPNMRKTGALPAGPGVWLPGNEKPERVKITTGISDGSFTEVLSGNIKEGQDLIVESLEKPKSGAPSG